LRRAHPVFRRKNFFLAGNSGEPLHPREINWQGLKPGEQDWSPECHSLAFTLNGAQLPEGEDDDFFIMLNGEANTSQTFIIPKLPVEHGNRQWKKIIETSAQPPSDFTALETAQSINPDEAITLEPMGCIVLQSSPKNL